jgi:ATP-dependent Clp protease ATP-binding subunit ClpC
LNSVDEIIIFNQLKENEVNRIVSIELYKLNERLDSLNYNVEVSDEVKSYIQKIGFDEKFGARPIKRAIQEKIEDLISEEVLRGNIKENLKYLLDIDKEEKLFIKKSK